MRSLLKKLGWVCRERAESFFFLVLGGLCARFVYELASAPVYQGTWYLFAILLAGPCIGSLCSAPSFKEEKKMEQRIRWRDWQCCESCKSVLPPIIVGGVIIPLLLSFLFVTYNAPDAFALTIAMSVFTTVTGLLVLLKLVAHFPLCEWCEIRTKETFALRLKKAEERKLAPNTTLCTSCRWGIASGFIFGVVALVTGIGWWMKTTGDAWVVSGASAGFFATVLFTIAARKKCRWCAEKEDAMPTVAEHSYRLSRTAEAGAWMTREEQCEQALRAYLARRDVVFKIVMGGAYAADIADAIGYSYAAVKSALERMGERVFIRLTNQSLVVRDYGYPTPP